MTTIAPRSPKVRVNHQAKFALVYIRQSSLGQVLRHGESTELQYQLVERAVQLGWPRERVQVIDEDLGKSGTSAADRPGFQQVMTEIGLGRVGLVISWEASRLARNNSDWHQLLELCSLFGTLVADSESIYDPRHYADRLLLGLSGMMSEAELHQLRLRLQAGARNKAAKGELRLALPVGLVRLPSGEAILNPDEEVQSRIRLVLQKFSELGTASAVVRYLQREKLCLPARPVRGPAPHAITWQAARTSRVLGIVKNPAYAGAYVFGRTQRDPTRRQPGQPHGGIVRLPLDEWPILRQDAYPAYIGWDEFVANQAKLWANQYHFAKDKVGAPRRGKALLQGILLCGRCGAHLSVRYEGAQGEFPVYGCGYARSEWGAPGCQDVRGLDLDAAVERLVFAALAPDRIALALAALAQLEVEQATLCQQWELRLERARYEAQRAQRQYNAVEPENRLVARTLERAWEEKLRAVEQVEQAYQAWRQGRQLALSEADRQEIVALGENLPQVWSAPTTTAADRKRIVRLLIQAVIVDAKRVRGKVWLQINWQTGAMSEHWYTRRVQNYGDYADLNALEQALRDLHAQHKIDREIAAALNAQGLRNTLGRPFTGPTVYLLRRRFGLPAHKPELPMAAEGTGQRFKVKEAATLLGVYTSAIYKWLSTGRLQGEQVPKGGAWHISLDPAQIEALRVYLNRVKGQRPRPA
jgi:DNA invertase Pin-like site-specific DNA recombinase